MSTLSSFSGQFRVYDGTNEVTIGHGVTYSIVEEVGCDADINPTTGIYTLASLTNDNAYAVLKATYKGTDIIKTFRASKSRAGVDGSAAKLIDLTATHQTFVYDSAGVIQTQNTTIKATRQNSSAVAEWRILKGDGTALVPWGTAAQLVAQGGAQTSSDNDTVTVSQFGFDALVQANGGNAFIWQVRLSDATNVVDQISIVRVRDGRTGAPAINAYLSNDNVSVESDEAGNVASFSGAGGQFRVLVGEENATPVSYSVVGSSGVLININSAGVYTVSGMTANSGTATLRAVYKGLQLDRVYTITKVGSIQTLQRIDADIDAAKALAATELTAAKAQLNSDIAAANTAITNARADLVADLSSLDAEVAATQGSIATARADLSADIQAARDAAVADVDQVELRATNLEVATGTLTTRITNEELARADADNALAVRATSLEARSIGGGNLLHNTTLETMAGWTFVDGMGVGTANYQFALNLAGPFYHPQNEFVLGMRQVGRSGTQSYLLYKSEFVSVQAGSYIQWSVLANAHRANVGAVIYYHGADGAFVGFSDVGPTTTNNGLGTEISHYTKIGHKSVLVPTDASSAYLELRKFDTFVGENDSFAWFWRPYIGAAREGQTEWNAFSHGSGRAVAVATAARLATEESARAGADSAITNRLTNAETEFRGFNTTTNNRIGAEELTRANADSALTARVSNAESEYRALAQDNTDRFVSANSRIAAEEITRSNADSALTTRLNNAETEYRGQDTTLNARIGAEESTRASADSALAGRSTAIEAKLGQSPDWWRVRSYGNYYSGTKTAGIFNPAGSAATGAYRSYAVGVFALGENTFETVGYFDVYGDPSQATAMAAYLNAIERGKTVVVYGSDEPERYRHQNGLLEAMLNCGAGDVFAGVGDVFKAHSAYILIGEAGVGRGGGQEYYAGSVPQDPNASLDVPLGLLKGRAVRGADSGVMATSAAIKIEEQARVAADSAIALRTTSLEARSTGGGNFLTNTTLETMAGWEAGDSLNAGSDNRLFAVNLAGTNYHPMNDYVLGIRQVGSTGTAGYLLYRSDTITVQGGTHLQWYVYGNAHRAHIGGTLYFHNAAGAYVGFSDVGPTDTHGGFGTHIYHYMQIGHKSVLVPSDAATATLELRKFDTFAGQGDSYAWFFRPYVGPAREGQTEWNPFVHGSGRAARNETHARLLTEESTRASADSALASRSTRLEATAMVSSNSINTNDKFANWTDPTVWPNGWTTWNSTPVVKREAGREGSPYGLRTEANTGAVYGFYQQALPFSPGHLVVEVTARRDSGSLSGAGVTISGLHNIDFLSDPDVNGGVGDSADGETRTWSKMFDIPIGQLATLNLHAMGGWQGFGRSIASHAITWYKLSVRQASAGEILAGKVNTDLGTATARIAAEELARATADSALATRANTMEAQFSGATDSGLKQLVNANRRNLVDLAWWKSGASIPWTQNGGSENLIYNFPTSAGDWGNIKAPDGSSGEVWLTRSGYGGNEAGGWNGGQMLPLNPDRTYRFAVPIAVLDNAQRTSYWGTSGVCDLNTQTDNPNPYFAVANSAYLVANRWYLFVGYIYPRNSTNKGHDGAGVWDMTTGQLISQGTNYCFHPDGRQPLHRAFQYYAADQVYQAFGRPTVELIDGSETDIQGVLGAARGVTTATARIAAEESTRASADSALASRSTSLEARVDLAEKQFTGANDSYVFARLRTEEDARASADGALATRASTLESQVGGHSSGAIVARIEAEENTRASADSALVTRASNLESTVGNHGARLTTAEGTLATAAGRTAAWWGVELDAGGRARIKAYADNYGSAIDIGADVITLGNQKTFEVKNGRATVSGDLFVEGGNVVIQGTTHMQVLGAGFGVGAEMIEWYGPIMPVSQCSRTNGISWKNRNGGMKIAAFQIGVLVSGNTTGSTASNAAVSTITGSNGGLIQSSGSWHWRHTYRFDYAPNESSGFLTAANNLGMATTDGGASYAFNGPVTITSQAITLRRNGVGVASNTTTELLRNAYGVRPFQGSGDPGYIEVTDVITLGVSYTDPEQNTANRTYEAVLSRNGLNQLTEQRVSVGTTE